MTSAQHAYSLVYGLCAEVERVSGHAHLDLQQIDVEMPWGDTYTVTIIPRKKET